MAQEWWDLQINTIGINIIVSHNVWFKPCSHCPCEPGRIVKEVLSYIPGNDTDQTRFGAKSDHGLSRLCYGLRRCIPGVAPEVLRCVPVRPDTPRLCPGHRQLHGVTRQLMNINAISVELITDMLFAKYIPQVHTNAKKKQTWFQYCFCSSVGVHRLVP